MRRGLGVAGFLLLALGALLTVRAFLATSYQMDVEPVPGVTVDASAAAQRLSRAVQIPTVSMSGGDGGSSEDFVRFQEMLAESFPRTHVALAPERIGGFSLLTTWKGRDPALLPVLLLAHQDVVPVAPEEAASWMHPPFSGRMNGGFVWGRGAMDDKGSLLAILEAVEGLLKEGFQPARTVYLAFGHDEELGGEGAFEMARVLASRNVRLTAVLDEGMAVTENLVPGVEAPVALIGIAEKGYLSLEISATAEGGHSSMPPPRTAAGVVAAAVTRIDDRPFPASISGPARDMFKYLTPEMSFPLKLVFSNRWLFSPLILKRLQADPSTNALVRTTTAVTLLESGIKENVLPTRGRAVINFRILPGETVQGTRARVDRELEGLPVTVRTLNGSEPSLRSRLESETYLSLSRTIRELFPGVVVAPGLVLGGTDSRHFAGLSDDIYRFAPLRVTGDDLARIHGVNERVSITDHARAVAFYSRLIRNWTR